MREMQIVERRGEHLRILHVVFVSQVGAVIVFTVRFVLANRNRLFFAGSMYLQFFLFLLLFERVAK